MLGARRGPGGRRGPGARRVTLGCAGCWSLWDGARAHREVLELRRRCWSSRGGVGARGVMLELAGRCWSSQGDAGACGVMLELTEGCWELQEAAGGTAGSPGCTCPEGHWRGQLEQGMSGWVQGAGARWLGSHEVQSPCHSPWGDHPQCSPCQGDGCHGKVARGWQDLCKACRVPGGHSSGEHGAGIPRTGTSLSLIPPPSAGASPGVVAGCPVPPARRAGVPGGWRWRLILGALCNYHLAAGSRRRLLLNYTLIPAPTNELKAARGPWAPGTHPRLYVPARGCPGGFGMTQRGWGEGNPLLVLKAAGAALCHPFSTGTPAAGRAQSCLGASARIPRPPAPPAPHLLTRRKGAVYGTPPPGPTGSSWPWCWALPLGWAPSPAPLTGCRSSHGPLCGVRGIS